MALLRGGLLRISGGTCWRTMRLGGVAVAEVEMMLVGTSWVEWVSFELVKGILEPFVGTLSLSVSAICHVKFVKS